MTNAEKMKCMKEDLKSYLDEIKGIDFMLSDLIKKSNDLLCKKANLQKDADALKDGITELQKTIDAEKQGEQGPALPKEDILCKALADSKNLLPYEMSLFMYILKNLEGSKKERDEQLVKNVSATFGVDLRCSTFAPVIYSDDYESIYDFALEDWTETNWYEKPEKCRDESEIVYGIRCMINDGIEMPHGINPKDYMEAFNQICDEMEGR